MRYEDPVKTIFHQIKFEKKIWLLNIFSKLLERSSVPAETNGYDLIVPVPLDRSRERNRGFNQAAVIAQRLVRIHSASGFRMVKILKKKKRTLPQSQLRRQDRLNNLAGAFGIRKQGMARNKRILLVDDIFTTGSTMNECAKILKEDGAERVDFLAVARS
ncbi:MAG: ComF family protein [Candidatus Omnitrophica bacterium]|nr:ComF family protein [Candidatus Omnitrophota bacterium]